ncbi:MAG: rRNA maturation RNase YbeY [Anaerolineales bacterium]|jgi:probable rRNA maturation factor
MIHLEILEGYRSQFDPDVLKKAARATLINQSVDSDTEFTLVVSDDEHLQRLNKEYRGIDDPTDVLAFPASFENPERGVPYLGDVLISYPQAVEQASQAGHLIEDELQLLVIHGLLHLLGHDHANIEQHQKMWSAQRAILAEIGLDDIAPK